MRVLVFVLISGAAHFLAARWVLSVSPGARERRRLVFGVAGVLSLVLGTLRVLGWSLSGPFFVAVVALAMVELAVVILSLLPLGLLTLGSRAVARAFDAIKPPADAASAEVRVSRRQALERGLGLAAVSTTSLALGWGMKRGRHDYVVEEVPIVVRGWPRALDGYVIAQVSDIHVGAFVRDRELDQGFELLRRARPDLIVATGDLVDIDAEAISALIARLVGASARDGAFAILGNHDHYAGAADVADLIRPTPVRLLANEAVRLRAGDGGGFALLGVDDIEGRRRGTRGYVGPDLGRALAGVAPDLPRILLAHQPRFFYEAQGRVALQLSGHTHGGQINPGFRPASALFEFVAGRYDRAGSILYVNRGFGTSGPPARIGAPPEITKLVIVAG